MTEFSYRDLEKCAAREVAMRINFFRRRGMGESHRREIAMMEAIRDHFKGLADDDRDADIARQRIAEGGFVEGDKLHRRLDAMDREE